jgi:hypothetical protein
LTRCSCPSNVPASSAVGLAQRVAQAARDVAAGALEPAALDSAPELADRGERRVVAHRRRLRDRVGLDRKNAKMPPSAALTTAFSLARNCLPPCSTRVATAGSVRRGVAARIR